MEAIKRSKTSASLVGARIGPTKAETGTYRVTFAVDERCFEQEFTLAGRCDRGPPHQSQGYGPSILIPLASKISSIMRFHESELVLRL